MADAKAAIGPDLDRIRTILRRAISQRGFSQKDVQEALGWSHGYITKLVRARITLRFEHVIMILNVIDVTPKEFFGEIYGAGAASHERRFQGEQWRRVKSQLDVILRVLLERSLISVDELDRLAAQCFSARRADDGPKARQPAPGSRRYTRAQLEALPVLAIGQMDDLHVVQGDVRVWLSRNEPYTVKVERWTPEGWVVVDRYRAE